MAHQPAEDAQPPNIPGRICIQVNRRGSSQRLRLARRKWIGLLSGPSPEIVPRRIHKRQGHRTTNLIKGFAGGQGPGFVEPRCSRGFAERRKREGVQAPVGSVSQHRKKGRKSMPLVQILLALIVVGVLLWLVNRFIPMQGSIKSILNGVVVIAVVLWLLNIFGLFHSTHIRVGT
jgi:hypothetical protein